MKKKFERTVFTFLFIIMCFINVNTVFAMEKTPVTNYDLDKSSKYEIVPASGAVSGIVPSNDTATFSITLDSYVGFSKEFIVNAVSDSSGGMLIVQLISPRNNVVSQDWIMGVNDIASWKVTLPSSGVWTVKISSNGTNAPVRVFLNWV